MNSFNLCGADLLSPVLKKKCFSNDISMQDIALDAMRSHPDVPFAFVQSKIDDIQQGFYIALGVCCACPGSCCCSCSAIFAVQEEFTNRRVVSVSIGDVELDEKGHLPRVVLCGTECALRRV